MLLNHPEWFENYKPVETLVDFTLRPTELRAAQASKDPGRALAEIIVAKHPLKGSFSSADLDEQNALLRFEGPKGSTDVTVDMRTGHATGSMAKANFLAFVQDLHRGKNSGLIWRGVIDTSAYLIIALSLVGYVLFFSLRFRLGTSVILTVVSLAALAGAAIWMTQ